MRTVALLRCSTDKQDVEFKVQRKDIAEWCARNGVEIAVEDWREEPAKSGASRKRPVLERILDEAERGEIVAIVVADFERAGRSGARTVALVEDVVEDMGVDFFFVREGWHLRGGEPIPFETKVHMLAKAIGGIAKLDSTSRANKSAVTRDGAGVSVSVRNGLRVGRPRNELPEDRAAHARARLAAGEDFEAVRAEVRGVVRVATRDENGEPTGEEVRDVTLGRRAFRRLVGAA